MNNWLLCGGIGSGKSKVREALSQHGVDTIDADSIGHDVLEPDGAAFSEVAGAWPEVIDDGTVNRALLGSIVFGDPGELERLESFTHPAIFSRIGEKVASLTPPVVVEVPLLKNPFDPSWKRIVVDAIDPDRLDRAIGRGSEREDVVRRMAAQPSRSEWLAVADLVIPNHGTLDELIVAVRNALPILRS